MKNLLVINQFASVPYNQFGAGERLYHLSPYLGENGYYVTVISGGYNHLFKKFPNTSRTFNPEKFPYANYVWVKLRKYKVNSFLGRVISWFEFLIKLFFIKLEKRPDIILVSSMSLLPIIYAVWIKMKYKSKFVLEIRDIWPLTPIEIGGYSKNNPLIFFLRKIEILGYKKADYILSVLPGFGKYLKENGFGSKSFKWIPNGVVLDENLSQNNSDIKFSDEFFNVVYTGAIGKANALEYLIEAARILSVDPNSSYIMFHIVGNGPERSQLELSCRDLKNVKFHGSIPKNEIQSVLKCADLCYIGWHKRKIYNYGVSANKYNDYMLSKTPLLSSSNIIDDPVILSQSGIHVPAESPVEIAESIKIFSKLPASDKELFGNNGYSFVKNSQTYEKISESYVSVLDHLIR